MKIVLSCAYRRTGKDTLSKILKKEHIDAPFKWRVYKHPARLDQSLFSDNDYERRAFADRLKEKSSIKYNIPMVGDDEKDIKQFKHYKTGELVSARDIYLEYGALKREKDPLYWCKAAFDDITEDNKHAYIITDWRFKNEAIYVESRFDDIVTIRLFRSDVPIPDSSIRSEHDLDDYLTGLLLVRDDVDGEFEKAIELFPQYKDYVACETV